MIEQKKVTILMAAYNGSRYLQAQLNSIIEQSYQNWELIIRDDGSDDDTCEIIKSCKNDDRIRLLTLPSEFKGACANFSALYTWAKNNLTIEYLMFADQDDIWKETKIEKTLNALHQAEMDFAEVPVMAYGNLELIDMHGKPLGKEFKLSADLSFNKTLVQNYALGCTMMLNKRLVDLMPDIPYWAENHDYWVSLIASGLGRYVFIEEKLIQYRQHGQNVTSQGSAFINRFKRFTTGLKHQISSLKKRVFMLKGFSQLCGDQLSPQNSKMLNEYLKGYNSGILKLLRVMFKYRIFKLGILQNLGLFFCIIFFYAEISKPNPVTHTPAC